jgi:hypothetical protein
MPLILFGIVSYRNSGRFDVTFPNFGPVTKSVRIFEVGCSTQISAEFVFWLGLYLKGNFSLFVTSIEIPFVGMGN